MIKKDFSNIHCVCVFATRIKINKIILRVISHWYLSVDILILFCFFIIPLTYRLTFWPLECLCLFLTLFYCINTWCISELSDYATLFFLVRQHWDWCRYRHFAANFKEFYLQWNRGLEHDVILLWTCFTKTVSIFCSLSVNFEESSGFIAIVLFHQPMPTRPGFETSRLLVLH
jgi:hypothetical protein